MIAFHGSNNFAVLFFVQNNIIHSASKIYIFYKRKYPPIRSKYVYIIRLMCSMTVWETVFTYMHVYTRTQGPVLKVWFVSLDRVFGPSQGFSGACNYT